MQSAKIGNAQMLRREKHRSETQSGVVLTGVQALGDGHRVPKVTHTEGAGQLCVEYSGLEADLHRESTCQFCCASSSDVESKDIVMLLWITPKLL